MLSKLFLSQIISDRYLLVSNIRLFKIVESVCNAYLRTIFYKFLTRRYKYILSIFTLITDLPLSICDLATVNISIFIR